MSLQSVLRERHEARLFRQVQARSEIQRLALAFRKGFAFRRLYLTGSLARGRFRSGSDIDLIVEGLDPGQFLKAYAFLLKESVFPIDLKPYEDLAPEAQAKISQEGTRLG